MCAVPSMNRSCHSNEDEPRSLAPSVDGTRSLSKRPVAVIVSLVAFPRSIFPLNTELPVTVRLPAIPVLPVVDATVNLSVQPDVLTAKSASTSTLPKR